MTRAKVTSVGQRTTLVTPDGLAIIAREYNAQAPHPHPSRGHQLVATSGINKILVDPGPDDAGVGPTDGVELYECDRCGKTADRPTSIVGHMPSHNPTRLEPLYPTKTLRIVVETVDKYKRARVRGYCERAATELTTLGVERRDGDAWSASNVSALYNHWKDRPEIRRRRTSTPRAVPARRVAPASAERTKKMMTTEPTPAETLSVDGERYVSSLSRRLRTFSPIERLHYIRGELFALGVTLETVIRELGESSVGVTELAELRAKAAKWDQVSGLLNG
jgi:hypothetical protein